MNIVFIGAGNVATHLSASLREEGCLISQIYSRTETSARKLAEQCACAWTTDIKKLHANADVYLFATKDDVLQELIAQVPANNGFRIHTSGSMPMDVFRGYARHYGVLYPLQTFSKTRPLDFSEIPCFIEAESLESERFLQTFASKISRNVRVLSSEKRAYLHLAAVFACNFTNHMYVLAKRLLDKQDIDWSVLQPLIDETAAKLHTLSPHEAQTGPAVRYDRNIIERQVAMLEEPAARELYELISKNIHLLSNI